MEEYKKVKQNNEQQFLQTLSKLDPELYLVKVALIETGVNPMLLPKIIRAISNLILGSGFGEVQIIMRSKVIAQIRGAESVMVNESASIET